MPVPPNLAEKVNGQGNNKVKRGDDIFVGDDPRTFDDFVGQQEAKDHLADHMTACRNDGTRLGHILIRSGIAGVGKTALAQIIAHDFGVGIVRVSGPMTVEEARKILRTMSDKDVLFWDEIHLAVSGGKAKAEWLLDFLLTGKLLTSAGEEQMPNVTVIGATTDAGKLPLTILGRFMIDPEITPYTVQDATVIAALLCGRMKFRLKDADTVMRISGKVALAADRNPRAMRKIITQMRDMAKAGKGVSLPLAYRRAGYTYDGLTREARDMLKVLAAQDNLTASIATIGGMLGEPGPLRHAEDLLIRHGYLTISGQGRTLTDEGFERAKKLVREEAS